MQIIYLPAMLFYFRYVSYLLRGDETGRNNLRGAIMGEYQTLEKTVCSHCGEECAGKRILWQERPFCCEGCKMVFRLLDKNGLCEYYQLNETPGINQSVPNQKRQFSFLDDPAIAAQLISFADDRQTHITFYLPHIHCSSCLYLLEQLWRLDTGVIASTVHFARKEISIVYNHHVTSLRTLAELLTTIGYEPHISLNDLNKKRPGVPKGLLLQLGVAGFCFANIMLMSFPEYLGLEASDGYLQQVFRYFNLVLSLPVLLYSAQPFYKSAWTSLKTKFLNIDAPIVLAILVTFGRSIYEVVSGTGAGYFDSMSGIVFFMLTGRVLQEKTYQHLSFDRDFSSYFPVAVTVLKNDMEIPVSLPDIKVGDTLKIHSEELIPADGIVTRGKALIDYSFVTGESIPVNKEMGEIVYAGGKQKNGSIELLVVREVSQSYLTKLWSREEFAQPAAAKTVSFVHFLSRYFTYILLTIAAAGAVYWSIADSTKVWYVVSSVLIVACPCALLLSNTFTNGAILNILSSNRLYLRNAAAIEEIASVQHIVFDKTGTLTDTTTHDVEYTGIAFTPQQETAIAALAAQSGHPLSKTIHQFVMRNADHVVLPQVEHCTEIPGSGIEGYVGEEKIVLGSRELVHSQEEKAGGAAVYVAFNNKVYGRFIIRNHFRAAMWSLMKKLSAHYRISVISGDNEAERGNVQKIAGRGANVVFNMKPEDKLLYIKKLQQQGERVMMIGDGLNDAGAFRQSNIGIALTDNSNNFTPSSDGILEAGKLPLLSQMIRLCRANRRIVLSGFVVSVLYNIIGISFALQAQLSPMVAAILMPSSSVSIILLSFGVSHLAAKRLKL